MVHKAPPKKKNKGGIDFKKIRRKIGRKLPPPNNATNTEIKSKAIILPEQSVASDKTGLAVSKKGLTLKELLQQTSHHNHKVRKDALLGVKDLISNHPSELRLHKYAIVEKLRERISDDDKVVREAVYQLFQTNIFPKSKEDNQSILVSSMMTHIFCAMTHLEIDIRLMAFKFLDLVVRTYPQCFSTYADEVLQNYNGILRNKKFYAQEKGKLKHALSGLLHCLSLLPDDTLEAESSIKLSISEKRVLHAFESKACADYPGFSQVLMKLKDLVPTLVNCLQELTPSVQSNEFLDAQTFDCMLCLLRSIDKAVRFVKFGKKKTQNDMNDLLFNDEDLAASTYDEIVRVLIKRIFAIFPLGRTNYQSGKDDDRYFVLNIAITEIFLLMVANVEVPGDLMNRFLQFIEQALHVENGGGAQSKKRFLDKNLVVLLTSIPKLLLQVDNIWKYRLLEAFSTAFSGCHHESVIKLACLSAIEDMMVPRSGASCMDTSDPKILNYHIAWIRELPVLTLQLGESDPSAFQVLMRLHLLIGQRSLINPSIAFEYDRLQFSLMDFYGRFSDGVTLYGPFTRMSPEVQELSISCLYYFSVINSQLLESLVACCLCPHLNSFILLRIIEVILSAYKAGHITVTDYVSFFISILSRYQVSSDFRNHGKEADSTKSNSEVFRLLTNAICSCLSQLGDPFLVLRLLENVTIDQMSEGKLPIENTCALLRVLMILDSRPTNLSEDAIAKLVKIIPGYLINVTRKFPEDAIGDDHSVSNYVSESLYYAVPCFILFHRSGKACCSVLNSMGSMISDGDQTTSAAELSSRTDAILSVISMINRHDKFHQILWSCKTEIDSMLHQMSSMLQASTPLMASFEDKHKVQSAADRLKFIRKHIP